MSKSTSNVRSSIISTMVSARHFSFVILDSGPNSIPNCLLTLNARRNAGTLIDSKKTHQDIVLYLINSHFESHATCKSAVSNSKTRNIKSYGKILCDLLFGLDDLIDQNAKIACCPIGVSSKSPILNKAFATCKKEDILVIAPSGNKGNGTVLSPGIHPDVLCVGAVDQYRQVANFSGRIHNENGKCIKPEIAALGVDVEIPLDNGEIRKVNGTSFSCAIVAGVAAALFEANPEATANDVKMALIESCTPAEGSRYGTIDPEKAMENIRTKVPYHRQPEPIELPDHPKPFIDYRLKSQCNRARKGNRDVEGLVVGTSTDELIKRLESEAGEYLIEYHPFKNFDMAHVKAKPEFYDRLFEQPDLEVCSAVDINYFDM